MHIIFYSFYYIFGFNSVILPGWSGL